MQDMHQPCSLSVLIVGQDWELRTNLVLAAERTRRFVEVESVPDAYDALVRVWDAVLRNQGAPAVIVMDFAGCIDAMAALVERLNSDPITADCVTVALHAPEDLDHRLCDYMPVLSPDDSLDEVMTGIAELAYWRAGS